MNLKDQLIKLGYDQPELREDLRPVIAELSKQATKFTVHGDSMETVVGDAKRKYVTDLAMVLENTIASNFGVNVGRAPDGGRIDTDGGWSVTVKPHNLGENAVLGWLENIDGRRVKTFEFAGSMRNRRIVKEIMEIIRETINDFYL